MRKYYLLLIPLIFAVFFVSYSDIQSYSSEPALIVDAQKVTSSSPDTITSVFDEKSTLKQLKTIIITGIVLTCDNGDPFKGVKITVMTLDGKLISSTLTNKKGIYSLKFDSLSDTFKVTASYPGHTPSTKTVTATSDPKSNDPKLYGNANFSLGNIVITNGSAMLDDKGKYYFSVPIDSNKPETSGPNQTLMQFFITNFGNTTATNLTALFNWTSNNTNITLSPNESALKNIGNLAPGQTVQLFYMVQTIRDKAVDGQLRNFNLTVGNNTEKLAILSSYITAVTMADQGRNTITSITPSSYAPHVNEIFTVKVVGNTSASNYASINIPLIFDPSLMQLINYTTIYGAGSTSNNITVKNPGANNFTGIFTFKALNPGNATLLPYFRDSSGNSEHYGSDYTIVAIKNMTVLPSADVATTKTYDNYARPGQTPQYNDLVRFNITVSNYGPNNATGVNITDLLPAGLTYLNHTISTNGGSNWIANSTAYNPTTGKWTLGDVKISTGQYIMSIIARVTGTNMTINNTVTKTQNEYDPNPANDNSSVAFKVSKSADISVNTYFLPSMCGTPGWPPVNNQTILTFINVTNNGPDNATGIQITDILPSTINFRAYSLSTDGGITWNANLKGLIPSDTYNETTGIWKVGNLTSGSSKSLVISGKLNATTGTIITNKVNKTAENEYDWNSTNDNSTVNITVA